MEKRFCWKCREPGLEGSEGGKVLGLREAGLQGRHPASVPCPRLPEVSSRSSRAPGPEETWYLI